MIQVSDFKNVSLLSGLADKNLNDLAGIARLKTYEEGQIIYKEGTAANNLYILKTGKALEELDLAPDVSIALASLKPGYIFGWHAMTGETYSSRAVSVDKTEVIVIAGDELRSLMDSDHHFGYQMMNKLFLLLKIRLDYRTAQFNTIMKRHPDLNLS